MNLEVCRDCGSRLESKSRGCTTCALNLEAETMIDRFVLRLLFSVLTMVAIAIGVYFYNHRF